MQSTQWFRAVVLAVFDSVLIVILSGAKNLSRNSKRPFASAQGDIIKNVLYFGERAKDYSGRNAFTKTKGKNDRSIYLPPKPEM